MGDKKKTTDSSELPDAPVEEQPAAPELAGISEVVADQEVESDEAPANTTPGSEDNPELADEKEAASSESEEPLDTQAQDEPQAVVAEEPIVEAGATGPIASIPATHISVSANTHSKRRSKNKKKLAKAVKVPKATQQAPVVKKWWQPVLIAIGLVLTMLIFVVGGFSQMYKGKVLPNVSVAGVDSGAKNPEELKAQLTEQLNEFKVTIGSGDSKLTPSLKEIGYDVDIDKTVEDAVVAKRGDALSRFTFWKKENVPARITVNDTLLSQYLESKLPKLTQPGKDARLEFNQATQKFEVTKHSDGKGPDAIPITEALVRSSENLSGVSVTVTTTKKPARITREKLESLIEPANAVVARTIVLQGTAGTYQALPSDIAAWITPTPQKDGSVKLIVDSAKVQSYVGSIGQLVSSAPQDKKVIKDKKTGKEMVLQQGRDGTELSGAEELAKQITQAVIEKQDITLDMSIKTARYKTVNMKGYDKWIEVDLSEQRTTAYEGATPIKNFLIASGMAGYETPVGEYAIWLRVRSQTMQGGSKADGSYYNLPNVEWVSYFYQDYALHGAYWRKVFGAPASHGCVNMTNADAQWVYNWAPVGTKVIVHS